MKIFPTSLIQQLDAYTIEHEPIASIDLMERAALALTDALCWRWGVDTPIILFAGPGNNGGDALAVARLLAGRGYVPEVWLFNTKGHLSPDCEENLNRLRCTSGVVLHEVTNQFNPPPLTASHVVVDGLFGSGLNKPLMGGFASVVKYINASPATVVAIDIPSGLMGEDNTQNTPATIIRAHFTLSLQLPKLAFFFAENQEFVGEWHLLDIGLSREAMDGLQTDFELADEGLMPSLLKPRDKFAHKGDFGRALLIAGAQGMAGASVLAARACLRSGVGLLTVHVPFCNNLIVQTAVPEAMTEIDYSDVCFSTCCDTDNYRAVAIGPGLGRRKETEAALLEQIGECVVPMVVDADALNLLADNRSWLVRLPKGSILTPHPKELERLVGKCANSYERLMRARHLASEANVHIILKGACSTVISPSGKCWINTTGNPGMATGGSGDVLTGVVLALLAQGYEPEAAARLATFAHGLAGDLAAGKQGEMGMTAGDIAACLPQVWRSLTSPSPLGEGDKRG